LFEARHPRDKSIISEVDGTVHHGPVVKGMRRVIVETDEGTRHEYSVLRGLKENVIVGRLIPAGTGMPTYRDIYMEKEEPAPAPTLEELLRPEDEEALSLADFEDEQ
jgi:hypothetical protein